MSRGIAAAAACRLALAYQNAGMRSVAGTAFNYGIEATARSSLPCLLTQILQRDGQQVIEATHNCIMMHNEVGLSHPLS